MNEWSRLSLVTAATTPVVTTVEAKRHMNVFHDDDDTLVDLYVTAATELIEGPNGIGIALRPQTWRLSLDYFPAEIRIPLGPVTGVTSVKYTDTTGAEQIVTGYRLDKDAQPARLLPALGASWPTICDPGAVKVEFKCGYAEVPFVLRAAVLLLAGHWYNNRETVDDTSLKKIPYGVDTILERYRVGRFG
ncbi:head-tail connector protein [Pseudaminobacter sp. NGMCC 1.201702]|uniref:head-tail connector protein n=1 Tax=Pseudaminobacter sp. NGMCC 1.201702 TaxID=3391825 RepID=UPI0039EF58E6